MTSAGELSHLYIAAPTVSARLDPDVLASTIARLLGSGRASCRADLVRATGLSRTTIDSGLQSLLRNSVIRHAGLRRTQGRGRSAELLELDPSFGYILVADCGAHAAALRVFDISQRELAAGTVYFDLSDGPERVLGAIAAEFARQLADMPYEPLVAVIGLPGPVDNRSGTLVRPPIMPGWDGFPITKTLTASLGCRVILENDVNLRALGEARAEKSPDGPLLYVKVGTGIGAGIVTGNGELLHGADGSAGDVGHLRVAGSDALCVCGNRGCLEAVSSASAIWRAINGVESVLPVSGREIQELQDLIVAGDPAAIAELRAAAEFVGEAVANLVHILNPARVVLGGMLVSSSDVLLAIVRSVVYQRALPLATRELMLGAPTLGTMSGIAGGLIAGIDDALATESISARFRAASDREHIA